LQEPEYLDDHFDSDNEMGEYDLDPSPLDHDRYDTASDDLDGTDETVTIPMDDQDTWSDDPIRMYLQQMGNIPLLSRQQEVMLARKIDSMRAKFCRKILECDYVLRKTCAIIEKDCMNFSSPENLHQGMSDSSERFVVMAKTPENLKTVRSILEKNKENYHIATSLNRSPEERQRAWLELGRGRRRAVKLIMELKPRTQRLEHFLGTLEEYSNHVDELRARIQSNLARGAKLEYQMPTIKMYRRYLMETRETPTSLRNRVGNPAPSTRNTRTPSRDSQRGTCVSSFPSQKNIETAD